MKYIRTKDGKIFDTEYEPKAFKYNWNAKFIVDDNNLIVYDTVFKDRIANHGQILKQADNIEELCDEFVKKSKQTWNNYFEIGEDALRIFDRKYHKEDLEHYDYYGAIWTDKGLIYVAKMNEKGELELL